MTHLLLALRAVNCPLLTAALVWLMIRLADVWPSLSKGRRLIMHGFVALLVAGIAGSAIKYLTVAPVDVSVLIVTLAGVLVLAGLWRSRHDRHH